MSLARITAPLGLMLCLCPRLALAGLFDPALNHTVPPEHTTVGLHTYPNPNNFGELEGGGKLLVQDTDPDWFSVYVYFPRGGGRGLILQNNLVAINRFLAAEVRRPKTVQTFLDKYLWLFLTDTLATDDAFPITAGIEEGTPVTGACLNVRSTPAHTRRLKEKIIPYECSNATVITGNEWTVDANVLTMHGAVEHWLVKGKVKPLRIDSFLCEPKESEGTFYRVLVNGG